MKKQLLSILFLFFTAYAIAQLGTAHDFTVTDIDGNEHNLYTWLDAGKVVVVDVSATWCPPCWSLHQSHALEDLHQLYGPDGTDQIRVLFYEGDAGTGMADLLGNTASSQGDWTAGVTYPIVNESPISLDLNVYAPLGFPTVNVIRPSDREIVADVYNQDLAGMEAAINTIITLGETSSNNNLEENTVALSLAPNPTSARVQLAWDTDFGVVKQVRVYNALGQNVYETNTTSTQMTLEVADWQAGTYIVTLESAEGVVARERFVKL